MISADGAPVYVERLRPPVGLWVAVALFAAILGFSVYVAIGPVAGLVALVLPAALGSAGLAAMTTEVRLQGGELRAGRAHIPVTDLGPAVALDEEQSRAVRGPRSDPAAFHVIRGWLPRGVQAPVIDPTDPTPYWYIASRSPERLAAAIEAARAR